MEEREREREEREREYLSACSRKKRKRDSAVQLCHHHHHHHHVVVGVCVHNCSLSFMLLPFFSIQNTTSHNKKSTNYFMFVCFLEMERVGPE
jgi:hypothetical protein